MNENIIIFQLNKITNFDIESIKSNRSNTEFCWTMASIFTNYILINFRKAVVYLDADLYFFNNVQEIILEISNHEIAAIPHRFPKRLKHLEVNGVFNVQFVFFAYSEIGLKASNLWAEQCHEWCYYELAENKLGDQKYLDEWPSLYKDKFRQINHIGAGLAPWNHENYNITKNQDEYFVNKSKLIFYHFHSFRDSVSQKSMVADIYNEVKSVPFQLYNEYAREINRMRKELRKHGRLRMRLFKVNSSD
jgi:hypothetical protein